MDINMEPLQRAFGDSAEFVHVNGVALAQGEPDAIVRRTYMDKAPFYEWFDVRRLEEDEDQSEEYFSSTKAPTTRSLLMIVLSMYYVHKKQAPFWWKLCISVCGWRVRDYAWCGAVYCVTMFKRQFETKGGEKMLVPLPSIHIADKKDPLHCESKELAHMYAEDATGSVASGGITKLFLEADEDHAFSNVNKYIAFYKKLAESIRAVCSDTKASQ
uniref:Uncharacterized protein n=1 Tax=Globisporangium ultimum (strain ATCC 200006 / CBS 805.95 / DAOM BR144) TaxID=431595 RepID=K3WTY5_GLOUD